MACYFSFGTCNCLQFLFWKFFVKVHLIRVKIGKFIMCAIPNSQFIPWCCQKQLRYQSCSLETTMHVSIKTTLQFCDNILLQNLLINPPIANSLCLIRKTISHTYGLLPIWYKGGRRVVNRSKGRTFLQFMLNRVE